jgi:hypothetical protein
MGAYSIGKGIFDDAGALTSAGTNAISQLTGKTMDLMNDLDTILVGTENLFTTKLTTMRDYNKDFSQDEKDAWNLTIAKMKALYAGLEAVGAMVNIIIPADDQDLQDYLNDNFSGIPLIPISGKFTNITVPTFSVMVGGTSVTWPSFTSSNGSISNVLGTLKPLIKAYAVQIMAVRAVQHKLLYYGPGPLPETMAKIRSLVDELDMTVQPQVVTLLTNVNDTVKVSQKILDRVNTAEQPRIEKLLDSTNDTVIDTQKVLVRFNTEEQPRIEKLLDNVNTTVTDTQVAIKNADRTIAEARVLMADLDASAKKIDGGLNLVTKYKIPILIVIGFTTLVWVAISIMTLLLLIKVLLGPNPL